MLKKKNIAEEQNLDINTILSFVLLLLLFPITPPAI
jgi:hypothetical protein